MTPSFALQLTMTVEAPRATSGCSLIVTGCAATFTLSDDGSQLCPERSSCFSPAVAIPRRRTNAPCIVSGGGSSSASAPPLIATCGDAMLCAAAIALRSLSGTEIHVITPPPPPPRASSDRCVPASIAGVVNTAAGVERSMTISQSGSPAGTERLCVPATIGNALPLRVA
jgi:hypothetical protein